MVPTTLLRAAATGVWLVLLITFASCSSSEADGHVDHVGPREAVELIASGEYVVLDLRSAAAFDAGHVRGAESLPYREADFVDRLAGLDGQQRYLVYSQTGEIAATAADVMAEHGFGNVVDAGAFGPLAIAGAPVEG